MRAFRRLAALGCVILATLFAAAEADAETLAREDLADLIVPPFSLGEPVNDFDSDTVRQPHLNVTSP